MQEKEDKIRIAFDFDGVIADTSKMKKIWLENKKIEIENVDKTSFYQHLYEKKSKEEIDSIYKEMSKTIFTKEVLLNTEPIYNSINSIRKISEKFEIYIITARNSEQIKYAEKWLEKYEIKKHIKKIISSSCEKKQQICKKNHISYLCDDDIRHLTDRKIPYRILYSNKNTEVDGIKKVNSWHEIEESLRILK